jgi:hypothetical protein
VFESSTRIHPYLKEDVERAEARAGCHVLSAQIFSIPYIVYEVDCEIQQSRPMTLLEEFLLRAAVEIKPPISVEDLADMLRVDPRFMEQTYHDLVELQALSTSQERLLQATSNGEVFYRQDRLPQPPQTVTRELVSVLPFTTLALYNRGHKQLKDEGFPEFPYNLEMQQKLRLRYPNNIDDNLLRQITAQAGQPLDRPEDNISFVRVVTRRLDRTLRYSHWAILVVHDLLADGDEGISIQLRSLDLPIYGQKKTFDEIETALQGLIETVLREKLLSLGHLIGISQSDIDQWMKIQPPDMQFSELESRAAAAESVVRNHVSETRRAPTDGTVELLRDTETRTRFLSTLKSAQHRVLMVSPQIHEETVDAEVLKIFRALAARRVITLWGTSKTLPTERLAQIITPEGLPAVVVVKLENQRSKDVIVDHTTHLCGAHHWISYRGDYLPCRESTYHITIPESVQRTAGVLERLFVDSAQTEYDAWLSHEADIDNLARLISIWIGSDQFTEAYRHMQHAAQNSRPEAFKLLGPLSQTISGTLDGTTPEIRAELLETIGELGLVFAEAQNMTKADQKTLVKSLQNLMNSLIDQDPAKAPQIKETFLVFWNSMGITNV